MTDPAKLKQVHLAIKQKFKDKNLIFGQGSSDAKIVLVSEVVGPSEIADKKPLSGPAAKVINQLLREAGIDKRKVYITNVVKYCPEPGATLHPKEIRSHSAFLKEELRTLAPQIVVTLGNLALNGVGLRQPVENVHGRTFNLGDHELFPTFHPTHAAKDPQILALLQADFVKLKQLLDLKKSTPTES